MNINLDIYQRGPRAWKLNNNLLLDNKYVEMIENLIHETMALTPYLNHSERWSELIMQCSLASKKFSKEKAVE